MIKNESPVYSNTRAVNTSDNRLTSLVDWVTVAFRDEHISCKDIINLIGLDFALFENHEESGGNGYPSHYRFGNIALFYGKKNGYKRLDISGQGCRELEQLSPFNWTVIFSLMLNFDITVRRLDLALDDKVGYFTLRQAKQALRAGNVRAKMKWAILIDKHLIKDGTNHGETIYFGSGQSRVQIRMYDKAKEMTSRGLKVNEKHWIRTELELRNERATLAMQLLANSVDEQIGLHIRSILANYLNFLIAGKDKNKSRWRVAHWWLKYLGDVDKLKLTQAVREDTVEKSEKWIMDSASASVYMIMEAHNWNPKKLIEILLKGYEKKGPKHDHKLDVYRKLNDIEYNAKDLSKKQYELFNQILGNKKDQVHE